MTSAKAFEFAAAYEAKCLSCETPVTVSTLALECCRSANHILKSRGEKLMSKAEIALCRTCYNKHYERMWAQERVNSDAYVLMWGNFRRAWMSAGDDDRSMLEKKLRQGMGDYWPSYSALVTAWKAQMETKKSRGTGSASKAGF